MRRPLLIAPLVLLTAACGLTPSPEEQAADAARETARALGQRLYGQSPRSRAEVGYSASRVDGVEVMKVTGTSTVEDDGIGVVVRVSGSAQDGWIEPRQVTVERCFTVRVSNRSEWGEEPSDADCPSGPPLTFAPPPEPPRIPFERVRARMPKVPAGGTVDVAEVRRALRSADLDPAIRTEIGESDGVVGVVLSLPGDGFGAQDCTVVRVAPGETLVWVPTRIQRMPGEGGCGLGNAFHPMPPPH
ncbi:translation initiation factor IF-2 [Streptomyces sp. NPDC051940]|uniref:translation initiation factor IF-2 n=1 Tax=Streptomyces sp. NPDC051940 TaxID=3155675 RepID=UPI0034256A37